MFNDARTSLEIRERTESVWKSRLMPVLVIILFLSSFVAYYLGKQRAIVDWQYANESLDKIHIDYSELLEENDNLKNKLEFEIAKSSRDLLIKKEAYNEITRTLASTSREITSLRENIRFYESIIEGDDKKQGLQIRTASLTPTGIMGQYRYSVIVINSDFGTRRHKGKLLIEVEGQKDDVLDTIQIYAWNSKKNVQLLFKYFQRVDGLLTIPAGFLPQRLHLTARLSGNKNEKKEKWYNWDILLNKGVPEQE